MECLQCHKPASSLHYAGPGLWICKHCYAPPPPMNTCRLFEKGHANPIDPEATTAHVRDIQARRYDTVEHRMYYDRGNKSYSFQKG